LLLQASWIIEIKKREEERLLTMASIERIETLWNRSILAEKRIKEIEEGTVHYETRVIETAQDIVKEIGR
jgi:hypothetical protein